MALVAFLLVVPISAAVSALVVRWMLNRPERYAGSPVTSEELHRERPDSLVVDVTYEYLAPVLEQVEHTVDWGFSSAQRESLERRVGDLRLLDIASAIFPVRHEARASDLLMHFMRMDEDVVRCRFEGTPALVARIRLLLAGVPQRA